jgi:hypothetical protein
MWLGSIKQRTRFNSKNVNMVDYLKINHHQFKVPKGDFIPFIFRLEILYVFLRPKGKSLTALKGVWRDYWYEMGLRTKKVKWKRECQNSLSNRRKKKLKNGKKQQNCKSADLSHIVWMWLTWFDGKLAAVQKSANYVSPTESYKKFRVRTLIQ